jgi:hypothetical protein
MRLKISEFSGLISPDLFLLDSPKFSFSTKPAHGVRSHSLSPYLAVISPSVDMQIGKSGAGGHALGIKFTSLGDAVAVTIFNPAKTILGITALAP